MHSKSFAKPIKLRFLNTPVFSCPTQTPKIAPSYLTCLLENLQFCVRNLFPDGRAQEIFFVYAPLPKRAGFDPAQHNQLP